MKTKLFLFAAIVAGVMMVLGFRLIKTKPNHVKVTSQLQPVHNQLLVGVSVGYFSTGDDPGEPFEVFVSASDHTEVIKCIATNNPPGNNVQLDASGTYNSLTNSVTGFSCTYAVHNVTPPENNTVNYTGPLTSTP